MERIIYLRVILHHLAQPCTTPLHPENAIGVMEICPCTTLASIKTNTIQSTIGQLKCSSCGRREGILQLIK